MPGRQEARGAISPERSRERWPPRGALERRNCPRRESPRLRRRYGTHDAWKRIDLAASRGALAGRAGRGRGVGGRRRHAAIHATLRQDGRNSRPLAARPAQLTPALSYQASKRARSVPVGGHSGAERSQRARFREAFSVGAAVFATDLAADVALRGTSDTDATNSVTTSATSLADLGDHITRLITRLKRRERHGLG